MHIVSCCCHLFVIFFRETSIQNSVGVSRLEVHRIFLSAIWTLVSHVVI